MRVGGAAVAMVQRVGRQALVDRHADVLGVAAALEGHADNVAASLYGGVVATDGTRAVRVDTPLRPDVVLWIPEETTSTSASRTALPAVVPFDDAVFNVGRTATAGRRPRRRRRRRPRGGDPGPPAPGPPVPRRAGVARRPRVRDSMPARGADGCREAARRSPSSPPPGGASVVGAALPAGGHSRVVAIDRQGTTLVD